MHIQKRTHSQCPAGKNEHAAALLRPMLELFSAQKNANHMTLRLNEKKKTFVKICKINMYNFIDYVAIISTFILVINKYIVAYNV